MKIAIGSDHAGCSYKSEISKYLNSLGHYVIDVGTDSNESSDYPDFGQQGAELVSTGKSDIAVLVCGTGIGMSITANKIKGIRAALCWNEEAARLARQHNDANVLCMGARLLSLDECINIVRVFIDTHFINEEKYIRRIRKIAKIDEGRSICE
ncbi:MAG: ribose 5-phosphate isomerase B [Actinobacteria bacterium]|nr:ribose 5-phosphate isomerase B [Actinomycetota bacterium]MBM3713757.1 ribose 5-phosphate isomerase B [Actinomycetota bacterium]